MRLPEDGTNECRNMLEYQLDSITWSIRSGALNVGLIKTQNWTEVVRLVNLVLEEEEEEEEEEKEEEPKENKEEEQEVDKEEEEEEENDDNI